MYKILFLYADKQDDCINLYIEKNVHPKNIL